MKIVVDLKEELLPGCDSYKSLGRVTNTQHALPFCPEREEPEVCRGGSPETLAQLDGPHMSGCPRLPESVRPQLIIGSSEPEIQATLVTVQDRLGITESEDEKQVSTCHRGDVHAGKCPSILPTQLPSREELRLILKAAALPSGSVLLAEGKRHGLSKEVASGAQVGPSNLVRSSWIQCCVSHLKCL